MKDLDKPCLCSGVQVQAAREAHTEVEDPDQPEGPGKGPVTKRQHFIVMRHGERIDEVCCFILIRHSNASSQYIVMRRVERIDKGQWKGSKPLALQQQWSSFASSNTTRKAS